MSEQIRCFRLRKRDAKYGRIGKHRDYVGLDRLQKYGKETYDRYNHLVTEKMRRIDDKTVIFDSVEPHYTSRAELCEMIGGKWVVIPEDEALKLIESKPKE